MDTILIVDDSATVRKLLVHTLKPRKYTCIEACDGFDALEKLATTPVDLVITDLNMPRLDGFGLVRALRKDRDYAEVPIIILTHRVRERNMNDAIRQIEDLTHVCAPVKRIRVETLAGD